MIENFCSCFIEKFIVANYTFLFLPVFTWHNMDIVFHIPDIASIQQSFLGIYWITRRISIIDERLAQFNVLKLCFIKILDHSAAWFTFNTPADISYSAM